MNRDLSDPPPESRSESASDRELFVIRDYRSIPASELRPMFDGLGEWLSAILAYKIRKDSDQPAFVLELRRLTKARHVPKRIQKHFDEFHGTMKAMGLTHSFDATIPALGPYSSGLLGMSSEEGDVHFLAFHAVTQNDGRIHDESRFGFATWLEDDTLIETISAGPLPRPHKGVDRIHLRSDNPKAVLRKHRERIRKRPIRKIPANELLETVQAEHEKQIDEFIARGIIRAATPAEVTRIRRDS